MDLSKLRSATAPLLTLALGLFTALAVALASFEVLWEAAEVQDSAFGSRLELSAAMAGPTARGLLQAPAPPAPTTPTTRAQHEEAAPTAPAADDGAARQKLAEILSLSAVDVLLVVNREGEPLLDVGPSEPDLVRSAMRACGLVTGRGEQPALTGTFRGAGDNVWQAACAPVHGEQGDRLGTAVALARPTYLAEQADLGSRTRALIVFLGALVGLGVIVGVRFILSPIREVAHAAERMASGERGVRVQTPGDPEIARVSAALNELASAVEAREDEIRSRLATVAQLSSMVAHEVRNPLQSLSLLATLARTEADDKEREALLTSIETEIHVLEGVVQRFLRSSGPLQISRSASDLVELVHKAMGVASPQAKNRQVNLELIAPARLPMTLDPSLVRRALENLMLNAIEFSGAEPPGVVKVEIARKGRAVTITVDDNGPGVPEDERDRVFKPYYSSKAGGTGLGLALVKQVFQAHGGTVRCEDSPLGGARFSATLPIDEAMEVPFAG